MADIGQYVAQALASGLQGYATGAQKNREFAMDQAKLQELVNAAKVKESSSGYARDDKGAVNYDPSFYTEGTPSWQRSEREAALKYRGMGGKAAQEILTAGDIADLKPAFSEGAPLTPEQRMKKVSPSYSPFFQAGKAVQGLSPADAEALGIIPEGSAARIQTPVLPTGSLNAIKPKPATPGMTYGQVYANAGIPLPAELRAVENEQFPSNMSSVAPRRATPKEPKPLRALAPNELLKVEDGAAALKAANDLDALLDNNKDLFGPIEGRIGSWNPWNEQAQSIAGELATAKQIIGKFLEGGVLRKEDEAKYERMLPQLSDHPVVARRKLDALKQKLSEKARGQRDVLSRGGYDTAAFEQIPVAPPSETRYGAEPPAGGALGAAVKGIATGIPKAITGGAAPAGSTKQRATQYFYSPSRNQTKIIHPNGKIDFKKGKHGE